MINIPTSDGAVNIAESSPEEYSGLVELWERSVRQTHRFLAQEDILYYKNFVTEALLKLKVYSINQDNAPLGFLAIDGHRLEMLFIDPRHLYQGLGRLLISFAFEQGITEVEVNEQNESAVRFYHAVGFEVIGRQAVDGFGKPYPILSMRKKTGQ